MRHVAEWLTALLVLTAIPASPQAMATSARGPGVGLILKADKGTYAEGEPIALTLQVANQSPQPVTLQFRTAQRYDFVVQEPQGREVWRWPAGRMFAQVLGEETLPSGRDQLTYRITVRERFPSGHYTVVGIIATEQGPISARTTIRIG